MYIMPINLIFCFLCILFQQTFGSSLMTHPNAVMKGTNGIYCSGWHSWLSLDVSPLRAGPSNYTTDLCKCLKGCFSLMVIQAKHFDKPCEAEGPLALFCKPEWWLAQFSFSGLIHSMLCCWRMRSLLSLAQFNQCFGKFSGRKGHLPSLASSSFVKWQLR